jgi:ribosomal protein S18 acetylase RimI-like enzyme
MHTPITAPSQGAQERAWIERLQGFFRQDGNRFSYQNILVAEESPAVVGLVLSFGGRDEARLNAAIGSWLEQEARDDEWYVDALAVFSNWGRRGIGTSLLHRAEQLARQRGYPKIALNVAQENTAALKLYTQLHYAVTERTVLYQRPFVRMVKPLEHQEPGPTH